MPRTATLLIYPACGSASTLRGTTRLPGPAPNWPGPTPQLSPRTVRTASPRPTWCSPRTHASVFYDLDTPVTLDHLRCGQPVEYIGPRGLRDFDLVLSYTGGAALTELRERLGARRVAPLYGSVDPEVHRPVPQLDRYRADLSYLGTYAQDRQAALDALFLAPARRLPDRRFVLGGSLYPQEFPWTENIYFVRHLPPAEHPAFYSSSLLTLNVTRRAMAQMGYCPSGRLFEAAACGAPILSDEWDGLDQFFEPGREILIACDTPGAIEALRTGRDELARIARTARERTLTEHTAARRAERTGAPPGGLTMWGIIPAAGMGSRIQPLAFSKELLPVGSRLDGELERPRAVSEYLVERMVSAARARSASSSRPGKSDILEYYGGSHRRHAHLLRRAAAAGRAVRRDLPRPAAGRARRSRCWWACRTPSGFPKTASAPCPTTRSRSCCSRWSGPELFDAVVTDDRAACSRSR